MLFYLVAWISCRWYSTVCAKTLRPMANNQWFKCFIFYSYNALHIDNQKILYMLSIFQFHRTITDLNHPKPEPWKVNKNCIQGIPAFCDFTIHDPRYFVILFQWKFAKKVDFRNLFKVRFLTVLILLSKNHTN